MADDELNWHATSVCIHGAAIVIRGEAGAGKSSLAMRLMEDDQVSLVSDDRTILRRDGDKIIASVLPGFEGQIEARGIGIVRGYPVASSVPVGCIVDLHSRGVCLNRLPDAQTEDVLGVPVRRFDFYADDVFLASRARVAERVMTRGLSLKKGG